MGRLEEAKTTLQEGLEALEVGDEKFWLPRFLNTLGWVHAESGEWETALKLNRDSFREALISGDPETINNARINVGENLTETGQFGPAREELETLWREVKRPKLSYTKWRYKTRLLIALANLYERCGEREKSLRFANNAISHARSSGAKKHLAKALAVKGHALRHTRHSAAKAAFKEALTLARTMGAPLLAKQIAGELRNNLA
jgi:tetratricopeptide (TPR) repeat protein